MSSNQDALSANKKALLKIRELKQQLEASKESMYDPIAVCSMACRFPKNADTPQKFWDQLLSGEMHVTDVPESRWDQQAFFDEDPETPGKMYTQKGVYLDQIDQMDPEFFGISPREATWVDPQQRLLMEVSWEAIERAGWIPEKVGNSTGVFVGWMHNDYQNEASDSFLNLNPYIATGAAGSFLCGRLAYYLGLHGPALAVDTACSSSLVALHLAIQSLQNRECDRALVGGVNVICSPTTNILTCKLKALSPEGHSRAFDASADGYLRGEGCGVIALRRLSDAERDGDQVLAVIRGSSIGHNGFSSGLTAPNPKAQEIVIRQALERAGLQATDVDLLEAHGTGTELGDPLEVQAAAAVLCHERSSDHPLLIGSVKTNIGHLEAAAGMAGLIKVLLAMQHDRIPGQLNFENPNPHIPWDKTPIHVLTEPQNWPNSDRRIAGVSAFGMSGTNAHVVLEAPAKKKIASRSKPSAEDSESKSKPALLTLSARTDEALLNLVDAYESHLDSLEGQSEFRRFCKAAQLNRRHFEHRAAVVADDAQSAIASLRKLSRSQTGDLEAMGQAGKRFKQAWQFTGQGSQYIGMGEELFQTEPVFRDAILQCEVWMQDYREQKLTEVLFRDPDLLHDTLWTQPGIFAIQMGLAKLLEHWGAEPDMVLGHSVGQYAAACVAGVFSWEDGLRLISERGRVISSLPRGGLMLAVFAGGEAVEELVRGKKGIDVGAYNVSHVVVSGENAAIKAVEAELTERGVKSKILQTSHAFHSMLMDPVLEEFAEFADKVPFHPARIPLVCNQSGGVLPVEFKFDGKYWASHIRGAVQYQASLETVLESKCDVLVELGPRPVLTGMAKSLSSPNKPALASCLEQDKSNTQTTLATLALLYTKGLNPRFESLASSSEDISASDINGIELPTYPFQRRRFWGPDKPRADHAEHHTAHPLLGSEIPLANASNENRFESFVDVDSPSWISDHQVMGATVMPGAAFVELAIEAARSPGAAIELCDLKFESPLRIGSRTLLQTVVSRKQQAKQDQGDAAAEDKQSASHFLESYSRSDTQGAWSRHFVVASANPIQADAPQPVDLQQLQNEFDDSVDVEDFYSFLDTIDLNYGERFQTIDSLNQSESGVLSRLSEKGDLKGYTISPTLLDGAFHSLAVAISRDGDEMFLPVSLDKVQVFGEVAEEVWCHANWVVNEGNTRVADLRLFSETGNVLVQIDGLRVQRIDRKSIRQAGQSGPQRLLHEFKWRKSRLAGESLENRKWWIVGSSKAARNGLAGLSTELKSRGHQCLTIGLDAGKAAIDFPSTDPSDEASQQLIIELSESLEWSDLKTALDQKQLELPNGIIWLLDSDDQAGPCNKETERNVQGLLSLVQWLRKSSVRGLDSGIQLLTSNAVSTTENHESENETSVAPQQTQYWGLGRVLAAECPEYRCRLIDVENPIGEADAAQIQTLADVLLTDSEENQIVIRNREYFVPRITPLKTSSEAGDDLIRADSSYLITGGLGKLGRLAARWLAEQGADQVVLVSRREPDEATQQFIEEIQALGTEVIIHNADVSRHDDVQSLFGAIGSSIKPLAGVIHSAGVLDDGLVDNQSWARFEKVLKPKIDAAWHLHDATKNLDLDFFVLYSSIASVLGSPGQSNYAMGNAYLDGLAAFRKSQGLPASSINWGPWTEGMADDEKVKRRLAAQGITALEGESAHQALRLGLDSGQAQCFVIDIEWRKLRLGADGKTPLILSELVKDRGRGRKDDSQLVAKLKKMAPAAQRELLVSTVQKIFQEVLASDSPPEIDRPLIEMGLDSLMAVEFGTGLQETFGSQYEIGPSLLFDYPTIEAIADYLGTLILETGESKEDGAAEGKSTAKAPDSTGEAVRVVQKEEIAIIGMSCRFPGANNVDEYWNNLLEGVDSVGEIPGERWDVERFFSEERQPGKMYSREGGFVEDIDRFDAAFFNISENEACWIDPQHRLLLENSYHALEHAGINPARLTQTNVGVFMGVMGQDYAFIPTLEDREVIEGFEGAGLSHSAGVGRISHLLGLEGPSVAVDTASSSSLVAVIQAMRSLQERNCNLALAGGANAILAPVNSLLMSKAGLLSPDGRCKSFSGAADGFGRGEGCGVVVLKRLSDAKNDNDRILAVIRGGAIGHNGFTTGLTTPSSKAQVRVIESAVRDAKISPAELQYLEAHGTGTEFGDPIEMAAAVQVYGKGRQKDKPLIVGSAKANIGHLEAAGGVSGLIKTVMALHHDKVPQQIHFDTPSKHIPWKRMPVVVPVRIEEVENEEGENNGESRKLELAAVTALGLAGTNAHVILAAGPDQETGKSESDETQPESSSNTRQHVLFASAKSKYSLVELLKNYRKLTRRVQTNGIDVSWENICQNAGIGRQHFDFRECVVAGSVDEAESKLDSLIHSLEEQDSGNGFLSANGHAGHEENGHGQDGRGQNGHGRVGKSLDRIGWYFSGEDQFTFSDINELRENSRSAAKQFASFEQKLAGSLSENESFFDFLKANESNAAELIRFVVYAGLAKHWISLGMEPDFVAGGGAGQFVAACVADSIKYEDALELNFYLYQHRENADWDKFESLADQFNYYPPNLSLFCPLEGREMAVHQTPGGSYWRRLAEEAPGSTKLWADEELLRCELLLNMGNSNIGQSTEKNSAAGIGQCLNCHEPEAGFSRSLTEILAKLYLAGLTPDFSAIQDLATMKKCDLPVYPFDKKRFWITEISNHVNKDNAEQKRAGKTHV